MTAYCCHCGEEEKMGDPEYIVLCGSCVQKCMAQPDVEQVEVKHKPIGESKTLSPPKRVGD